MVGIGGREGVGVAREGHGYKGMSENMKVGPVNKIDEGEYKWAWGTALEPVHTGTNTAEL